MIRWSCVVFLLCGSLVFGNDKIRVPRLPVIPEPKPAPVIPITDQVIPLTLEHVFCVDSDVECVVLSSPKNALRITAKTGPITVRGKFVGDSTNEISYREFKGPFLYFVEPQQTGPCELIILPVGGKEPDVVRCLIENQLGPRPPPQPNPDPKPDPKPKPKVEPLIPEPGLHVLMIYDPAVTLTPQQNGILYGNSVRKWLDENCAKEEDGKTPSYLVLDSKYTDFSRIAPKWKTLFDRPREELPWLIIVNGTKKYEGKLPANNVDFLDLIKDYK
jgi:hypothetical protein